MWKGAGSFATQQQRMHQYLADGDRFVYFQIICLSYASETIKHTIVPVRAEQHWAAANVLVKSLSLQG